MIVARLRQIALGSDAEPRAKRLEQDRHQIRKQNDAEQGVTEPGWQRTVRLIGRQQTLQSSISDCSACEVSICNGKTSPQCGQVISVSTISCMLWRRFVSMSCRAESRHL